METIGSIKRLFVIVTMLVICGVILPSYAVGDEIALRGTSLTDPEMAEIRGGFQMSNGNFIYFSMDFMQVRFLSHSEPNNSGAWMNTLSQRAVITNNGMAFDMQIVQAGGGDNNGDNTGNSSGTLSLSPEVSIANSFMNNSGFINANLVTGNYNAASIANLINIHVGFFNIGNPSQVLSALTSWLPPY